MKNIRLIVFFVGGFLSCSGDSNGEKELFKRVKIGMTISDVKAILGKPDEITHNSADSTDLCLYFFTKNKSALRPSLPTICFDKSEKVVSVDYGDK